MFVQAALIAAQMWLGEITRPRPKKVTFAEFLANNKPSEVRPVAYGAGTFEITPPRIWYGDFKQRAVERDSHWTDYLWAGLSAGLLDFITVAYRYYIGEAFQLCWGPDTHIERITINDRLSYQAAIGFDNAGSGFLIDDPQAWGGDQPPGEGGEYAWIDITRGNYTDAANAYIESLLSTPPNKTQSLRGISCIFKRGPTGFRESGYFAAGGVGASPRLKEWKVVCRRQPDNLATGFNKVGRHANPMEVIYEWTTSLEYGARLPTSEIDLPSWRQTAQDLSDEGSGWSGRVEGQTQPIEVVRNVLAQIDGVLDPSPSLGLTMRLIRRDYSFANLRTLDRDTIVSVTRFSPGTYDDTINKVIVPFEDQNNNFEPRPGIYIDPANQTIQDGRIVPQTQDYKGVGDYDTANALATRDGRALSVPRAPLECTVRPSFGRLTYRGEVLKFNWSTPTFTKLMRVLSVTPGNNEDSDYALECIEDQFASGFRVSGEPQTGFDDPAEGLNTAPPSASWNTTDFPPDGLTFALLLDNTNQFNATITGGIVFAAYAPGGQYARIYVTEPGGVQTLSPMILSPDGDDKAMFQWPAVAAGTYQFCVQTYSLRGATNGVKVCADIVVANIGSPSASPSASVSPSYSVSPSVSPSPSISQSPSVSPSHSASASPSSSASVSPSISPSSSQSPSSSASASTSASVSPSSSASASVSPSPSTSPSSSTSPSISPSASTSPSSSASPSTAPGDPGNILIALSGDIEPTGGGNPRWFDSISGGTPTLVTTPTNVHDHAWSTGTTVFGIINLASSTLVFSAVRRIYITSDTTQLMMRFSDGGSNEHVEVTYVAGGNFRVTRNVGATVLALSTGGHISLNTQFYVSITATVDDTTGSFTCNLYDDSLTLLETLSASNVDTREGATSVSAIVLGGGMWEDFVFDDTGQLYTPMQVETVGPTGAGDLTQLTASTGSNWQTVDEKPVSTGDFNTSSGADQFDTFTFPSRSVTGTPRAAGVSAAVVATSGTPQFRFVCRISGVTYEHSTTFTSSTSSKFYGSFWQNNPSTGSPWSDSEITAAQFGIKALAANVRVYGLYRTTAVEL